MNPVLDRSTGRLRISDAHLAALLALAQGVPEEALHADDVASLRAAGLLGEAGPEVATGAPEAVTLALAGVNAAQLRLEVSTTGPRGHLLHRVWVGDGVATVAAHLGEDLFDVFPTPAPLVVAALARLLGLSPRRLVPGRLVEVADDAVAALSGSATDRAVAVNTIAGVAPAGWDAVLEDLRAGNVRLHGLGALWVGPDGEPTGRRFALLDTPHGLLEVVETGGRSGLRPVRSTDVWILLAELLPSDAELAPDSDVAPVLAPSGPDPAEV